MRDAVRIIRFRPGCAPIVAGICLSALFACTPLQGYPRDPEDTDATLQSVKANFDGTNETQYLAALDDITRTQKRNTIIYGRMRGYDIEFSNFEKALYSQSNGLAVGSDLVALVLGGLTATIGNAGTKAALGAASIGVLGANTAINKDLYYQKTIVALIAQMEANRANARNALVNGLKFPDSQYNLFQAYSDLDIYKNAGSIPGAISVITQSAETAKQDAQEAVVLSGLTLETPAVRTRYAQLTKYIQSLVVKKDVNTLSQIANALNMTIPPGSTYLRIKAMIVRRLDVTVNTKVTEADKQAALDGLATTLRQFVSF